MLLPSLGGQTSMCVDTVPRGEYWAIYKKSIAMARDNGLPGSAKIKFQTRKRGESWQTKAYPEISNSVRYLDDRGTEEEGGVECSQFTDIRWNIESVSDNGTVVSGDFDYRIIKL